ncbi:MAG TPA: hypothetical protein VN654_20950 [Vicinamibacterales bacterium]|jgi:hypothetical protein|nr:hypothetical protein [Vicinamibacterales bacterium]
MKTRLLRIVFSVAVIAAFARPAAGQAFPRAADGKPDLSGIWQAVNTANWNVLSHNAEKDVPAGLGVVEGDEIPYQPSAAARQKENFANRATADPESKCYLPGVPRIMYMPYPFQIFQTPNHIAITFEYVHAVRRIFMNTPHPDGEVEWFMGDSRGHWEGDTLVVDVKDFTGMTWFDRSGNYHSESLHVVERYTPMGANNINYEATIEDPKVFTRPWKMSMPLYRRVDKGMRILENECYAFGLEHTWLRPPQ